MRNTTAEPKPDVERNCLAARVDSDKASKGELELCSTCPELGRGRSNFRQGMMRALLSFMERPAGQTWYVDRQ